MKTFSTSLQEQVRSMDSCCLWWSAIASALVHSWDKDHNVTFLINKVFLSAELMLTDCFLFIAPFLLNAVLVIHKPATIMSGSKSIRSHFLILMVDVDITWSCWPDYMHCTATDWTIVQMYKGRAVLNDYIFIYWVIELILEKIASE